MQVDQLMVIEWSIISELRKLASYLPNRFGSGLEMNLFS